MVVNKGGSGAGKGVWVLRRSYVICIVPENMFVFGKVALF